MQKITITITLICVFGLMVADAAIVPGQFKTTTQIPATGGGALGSITANGPGSYTVVGGGNDIWDAADDFTFHYDARSGDFDVRVRVQSVEPAARWTKAGLMVRETTAADSRKAWARVTPFGPALNGERGVNDIMFSYRTWMTSPGSNGGQHEDPLVSGTDAPTGGYFVYKWIRLQRASTVLKAYASIDGRSWLESSHKEQDTATWLSPVGGVPTPFATDALLGLAVSRHGSATQPTATVEFRDYGSPNDPVAITTQPADTTALVGQTATFYVGVGGGSDFADIQWKKNGVDIPGATEPTYTTPPLTLADDGAIYSASVSNRLNATMATSNGGILTVLNQVQVIAAGSYGNPSGVTVFFSTALDPAAALNPASYSLDNGVTVSGAVFLRGDTKTVLLTTSAPLLEETNYQLTVTGVTGAGTPPAALTPDPSVVSFTHGQEFTQLNVVQKRYLNINGTSVDNLLSNAKYVNEQPDDVTMQPLFELRPVDGPDNYGAKLEATLIPPVDGVFGFWMCSDDNGRLYLSTDENPANLAQIAYEPEYNGSRNFAIADRRPAGENRTTVTLVAGVPRLVRLLMKEGGGGDNGSLYLQLPGTAAPADGAIPASSSLFKRIALQGSFGHVFTNYAPITLVSQPANRTAIEGQNTTFSVKLGDCTPPTTAQWYQDDVAIPGANGLSYTVQALEAIDGFQYHVVLRNEFSELTTTPATLTVISDTTPPRLVTAEQRISGGVLVHFDEPMGASADDAAKYTITGGSAPVTVTAAARMASANVVALTLAAPLESATAYTVSVRDVQDQAFIPNTLTPSPSTTMFYTFIALTNGIASFERWDGPTGAALAGLTNNPASPYPFNPTVMRTYTTMDTAASGDDQANNYGARLSAILVPSQSGVYRFRFITDDQGVFYMSQDVYPSHKQTMLEEPGCCAWIEQPAGGGIFLAAGRQYYIEILYKEAEGGDYGRLNWIVPGDANWATIPSANLWSGLWVTINGPEDLTVPVERNVSFCSELDGIGVNFLQQQWLDNFGVIPGANATCYDLPTRTTLGDDGKTFQSVWTAKGGDPFVNVVESRVATLHVVDDSAPPMVVSIECGNNKDEIVVHYDEEVEPGSATTAFAYNFGGQPMAVDGTVERDGRSVRVKTPFLYDDDTDYEIIITDVQDRLGNSLTTNVTFHSCIKVPGFVTFDYYPDLSTTDNSISQLTGDPDYPNYPAMTEYITAMDSRLVFPTDSHEGYGARMRGFFVPPADGNWIFYIYSDDSSQLWFNAAGDDYNGMALIAEETGCCGPIGKAGTVSAPIPLTAGQHYAIMLLYKEGTGGDYGYVYAKTDADPTPPEQLQPIPGSMLAVWRSADVEPPSVTIRRLGGDVIVEWASGVLQSAPSVLGPWTDVSGSPTSPYTAPATGAQLYFRGRQ